MKRIKYLLLLCIVAIISTGCVKFNAKMDIKKDKSMEFTIVYALDKTMFGESKTLKEEDFAEAKAAGFTITKYTDGNMEGFTLSKSVKNIDDVSSDKDGEYDLSGLMGGESKSKYLFKVEKGLLRDTYTAVLKFDANASGLSTTTGDEIYSDDEYLDDEDDDDYDYYLDDDYTLGDEDETDDEDLEVTTTTEDEDPIKFDASSMANLDLSFNVSLPYGAISNNATKTSNGNKDLTWTLLSDKAATIEFKFAIYNMTVIYIGAGVLLAIIALVLIIVLGKKGKKKYSLVGDTKIEIKNDANDNVVSGPVSNEKVNVVENNKE